MNDVPGKLVGEYMEATAPGDFWWDDVANPARMTFRCPCGCNAVGGVVVAGDATKTPVWSWDGSLKTPTINPSIRFIGGCGWHGFLTSGIFKSC